MTTKHFKALARILAQFNLPADAAAGFDAGYAAAAFGITSDVADYLATQNSNFDRARFLKACGL